MHCDPPLQFPIVAHSLFSRGGKSPHVLHSSRTDNCVKRETLVKVEVLIHILYLSKSQKVQALKCTQSIKVKNGPLRDISTGCFCAKLTETQLFTFVLASLGFVLFHILCHFHLVSVLVHVLRPFCLVISFCHQTPGQEVNKLTQQNILIMESYWDT